MLCLTLLLIGCENSTENHKHNPGPHKRKLESFQGKQLQRIEWETYGGGTTYFEVEPTDDNRFRFYRSELVYDWLYPFEGYLSRDDDPKLFDALSDIFQGKCVITNTEQICKDEKGNILETGSWTHLTFIDYSGEKTRYFKPTIKLDDDIEFSIWDICKKAEALDPFQRKN